MGHKYILKLVKDQIYYAKSNISSINKCKHIRKTIQLQPVFAKNYNIKTVIKSPPITAKFKHSELLRLVVSTFTREKQLFLKNIV